MLNDEPIFFENDSLIDKEMRKKYKQSKHQIKLVVHGKPRQVKEE